MFSNNVDLKTNTILNFMCARIAALNLFQVNLDKSWNYLWILLCEDTCVPVAPFSKIMGQ